MNRLKKSLIVIILCIATALCSTIMLPLFGCAKPKPKTFTVAFDSNGGSSIEAQTVKNGEMVDEPETPTREGYVFAFWTTQSGERFNFAQGITNDITLYASWEKKQSQDPVTPNTYTVTFMNESLVFQTSTVADGETVSFPATPERAGYIFDKWVNEDGSVFDFSVKVHSNLVIKAVWKTSEQGQPETKENYKVTFNSDGGSTVIGQLVVGGEKAVSPETPAKAGYVFDKWVDENNEVFNFDTPITSNITLKAIWQVAHYAVTFDSDGGSEVDKQYQTSGEKAAKPDDPTKTGYTFAGWVKEDGTDYDFNSAVVADITLTAKWTANTTNPNPAPSSNKHTFTYDYSAIANPPADKAALTQANFTGANSFLTVVAENKVTYRNKDKSTDSKSPDCIENKEGGLSVTFKGTGTITISFSSTSGSNTSSLELRKADDSNVTATTKGSTVKETNGVYDITGTKADSVTFTITEAGTYTIYCSFSYLDSATNTQKLRGARITAISMEDNYTE